MTSLRRVVICILVVAVASTASACTTGGTGSSTPSSEEVAGTSVQTADPVEEVRAQMIGRWRDTSDAGWMGGATVQFFADGSCIAESGGPVSGGGSYSISSQYDMPLLKMTFGNQQITPWYVRTESGKLLVGYAGGNADLGNYAPPPEPDGEWLPLERME